MVMQGDILKEYSELKQETGQSIRTISGIIADKHKINLQDVYILILGITTNYFIMEAMNY